MRYDCLPVELRTDNAVRPFDDACDALDMFSMLRTTPFRSIRRAFVPRVLIRVFILNAREASCDDSTRRA
jgi:hypothetical protein